ncbi:transcriptional regulator [Actinophytocola xinjiangensis]|uniref:Transcriptional regulator n=1 Tax=Actinophytocola xinjiangensis TaxID=485602 RepID=A0A7Z0WHC7_9PSEU|nr:helix-turn-helix transcriptional regulator [Actinophytocola xinjiangensis]OLF05368.1 transcriptional regulator [Actinophytocola xinjiangensis]
MSGVSSLHEARLVLGKRLRELRRHAELSGRQLAEALAWPPSKVSKLENGRQSPTEADIRAWTKATDSLDDTEGLLASLHMLTVQHIEWQRQLRGGLKTHQTELAALDAKTRLFRALECTFVPGLLQTAEYARARFRQSLKVLRVAGDVDEAVQARIRRQEILYRADKRFHFVLTEAALRYRLCTPEVMLGQLDRLIALSALPNMKFGIIGFETPYVVAPTHGFWLLDDDRVMVETFSAELNLAQPQEIELYRSIFESMATAAVYGRSARSVIKRVIDDLSAEAGTDGD